MGCSTSSISTTNTPNSILPTPVLKQATHSYEIRDAYTLMDALTFSRTTCLFHGQENSTVKSPVFVRYAAIEPDLAETVVKRFDTIKSNEAQWARLLRYVGLAFVDSHLYLVMDNAYAAHYLLDAMTFGEFALSESNLCITLCPIFDTLRRMHECGVVHGQINPEKLLLVNGVCYLYDVATTAETPQDLLAENCRFLAPEVLHGQNPTSESDVWSLGATIYYFLTGRTVFQGLTLADFLADARTREPSFEDPLWAQVSVGLVDLLKKMLRNQPADRIRLREVMRHVWTQGGSIGLKEAVFSPNPQIAVEREQRRSVQKSLYLIASKNSRHCIEELTTTLGFFDAQRTAWIEYGVFLEQALGREHAHYEDSVDMWRVKVPYTLLLTNAGQLSDLILQERLLVVFYQLGNRSPTLREHDVAKMLDCTGHSEYLASPSKLKELINKHSTYSTQPLSISYPEFVQLCTEVHFHPSEDIIVGKFFND